MRYALSTRHQQRVSPTRLPGCPGSERPGCLECDRSLTRDSREGRKRAHGSEAAQGPRDTVPCSDWIFHRVQHERGNSTRAHLKLVHLATVCQMLPQCSTRSFQRLACSPACVVGRLSPLARCACTAASHLRAQPPPTSVDNRKGTAGIRHKAL